MGIIKKNYVKQKIQNMFSMTVLCELNLDLFFLGQVFPAARCRKSKDSRKTSSKTNEEAVMVLKNYLTKIGTTDVEFENFTTEKLAETLNGFYIDAINSTDGQMYKMSSMERFSVIRNGLNRFLQDPPNNRKIDIIKDMEFRGANIAYRHALKELKLNDSCPISEADLKTVYDNMNTDTPSKLQAKVQFDVCFFLLRHGPDKMYSMTKDTFVIKKDSKTGLRYVTKRDNEINQYLRGIESESYSAFMPECPGDPKCPVASFEKLLNHLNPEIDSLWQTPRNRVYSEGTIWFYHQSAGEGTINNFMMRQSTTHNLSQIYSNDSIRATGVQLLKRAQFGSTPIMPLAALESMAAQAADENISVTNLEKLQRGLALNAALGIVNRIVVPAPVSQPTLSAAEVCAIPTSTYHSNQSMPTVSEKNCLQESEIKISFGLQPQNVS